MTTKTIKQSKLYAGLTLPEGAMIVVNGQVMQYNAGVIKSLPRQKNKRARDRFDIVVNKVDGAHAHISDEAESFWVRADALEQEIEGTDDYQAYQDWVAGAIIRDRDDDPRD